MQSLYTGQFFLLISVESIDWRKGNGTQDPN